MFCHERSHEFGGRKGWCGMIFKACWCYLLTNTHNRHHPLLSSSTFIVVRAFIHVQASASKMAYHKHKKTLSEKIKTKMGFSLSPFPCHLLLGKWIEEIAEIRSLNTISALFLACLLAGVMKLTQISNKFQIDES